MNFLPRAIAGAAFAVASGPALSADPTVGTCAPTAVKYVASDALAFKTISSSYVDLPQARVVFRQGGKQPSCVLVRFSAAAKASDFSNMGFRALLDSTEALPFEGQISDGVDVAPSARRFTFVFPNVSPGVHTIQIQHEATSPHSAVAMNAHNTIVWFAP